MLNDIRILKVIFVSIESTFRALCFYYFCLESSLRPIMLKKRLDLKAIDRQQALNGFVLLLFALVVWAAHFQNFQQFSLYREDFTRVPLMMQWTWAQVWQYWLPIGRIMVSEEGRPLHTGLIYIFARLGVQLGGLPAMYVLAYVINLVHVLLFHRLMQRSTQNAFFALTSTFAFALFPANTNHAWLTSAFGILPASILFLIASHLYLSDSKSSRKLSYLLIFISLFCYEKFLPLFWVAPLLKPTWKWSARSRREQLRHTAILMAFMLIVLLLRKLMGESRVNQAIDSDGVLQVLFSVVAGPLVSIGAFIFKPLQALTILEIKWIVPLSLLLVAIACGLYFAQFSFQTKRSSNASINQPQHQFPSLGRLLMAGFAALILAYVLTLTGAEENIYRVNGRASLVHLAAAFGTAILWGCACCGIQLAVSRDRRNPIIAVGLASFFTLLIASGFKSQQEFVAIAQYQRTFWTDVSQLSPDMTRRSIILIDFNQDPAGLDRVQSFNSRFPGLLSLIYKFPSDWINSENPLQSVQPKAYRLDDDWQEQIAIEDDFLNIDREVALDRRDLPGRIRSNRVIFLRSREGRLFRQFEPLVVGDRTFNLKQNQTQLKAPPFPPNFMFDLLMFPADSQSPVDLQSRG